MKNAEGNHLMTHGPVQEPCVEILSRRLVCENQRFHVFFDHVLDHAGWEVPDYLVVAPKQKSAELATGVAILPMRDDKVGLVRIYRPALRDYVWEIPHGFVEPSESSECSAVRELMEEAGIIVDRIESLGLIAPDAGVLAGRVHLYRAQASGECSDRAGETGLREFRWFSIPRFEAMIRDSEIQDSFTLSAWCRLKLLEQGAPHGA